MRNRISAVITGIGHYLPAFPVSSDEVEEKLNQINFPTFQMPSGLIERLTGVSSRYHTPTHTSSDLAAEAGRCALENAHISPSEIELLIFASASHDVAEPATSAIVQEKLSCPTAHVLDVKNACNSFLNALDIANSYIQTGRVKNALVVAGEVLSPFINWKVQDSKDLYLKFAAFTLGDGGGAAVMEAHKGGERGVRQGRFYSDGSKWMLSTILSGGTLLKEDVSHMFFECDSSKLQALATTHLPRLILDTLTDLSWEITDIKLAIPHQVSMRVIQIMCESLNFPLEKCEITLPEIGNTAAASIPIALSKAVAKGRVNPGDKILLVGGAAGFSAAVIPIVW